MVPVQLVVATTIGATPVVNTSRGTPVTPVTHPVGGTPVFVVADETITPAWPVFLVYDNLAPYP